MEKLLKAIEELLSSENNEGCSDNLTVVSRQAIEKLRAVYDSKKKEEVEQWQR